MSTAATAAHARQPDRAEVEANARRCDEEWKRGVVVVSAAPRMLTIETTSRCNLRCVMCHHGLRPADPAYEHFPEALTDRLRGVIRLASYVQLHGLGEPLLNSAFWNMLELTHENQYVQINSNGLLLDGSTADRLLATGLDEVSFSLDAATPETYRKIRGADFTRTIANIRGLLARRDNLGRRDPRVSLNMTLMRENIAETVRFVELARELGVDQVQLGHMNRLDDGSSWRVDRDGWVFDYREQMLANHPALSNRMINAARERAAALGIGLHLDWAKPVFFDEGETAPERTAAATPDADPDASRTAGSPSQFSPRDCSSPWNWMLIRTNGDVHPCCFRTERLGSIRDRDPFEIWNGKTAVALRRRLLADDIHPVCSKGVCKFVHGKPCREDSVFWSRRSITRCLKRSVRSTMGETAWAGLKRLCGRPRT